MSYGYDVEVNWNTKLKFAILYPSERDGVQGADRILGLLKQLDASGIGYNHEQMNYISKWGLGLKTKPSNNKTGKVMVSELDWTYKFMRWLAKSDEYFDIKVVEVEEAQNVFRGQWSPSQEEYIGCKIDPFEKSYQIGEEPIAVMPFSWSDFKYYELIGPEANATLVGQYIGSGLFVLDGMPTAPQTPVVTTPPAT